MKPGALDSGSVPSLRRRLLLLVSVASLLMLGLASSISYQRARHEVQELMDDQLAKTAQLVLAQAESGDDHFRELPARIAGIHGLRQRHNQLTLEYQIGRPDGTVLTRSPDAPATPINGPLGYATLDDASTPWRSLLLESADHGLRIQVVESIPKRDKEALEIAYRTVRPLAFMLPLLLLAIYFSVRRGLKPLDDLASEVSTRSADNMAALATRNVPREAQPLVAAINRLLFRLGQTLENERRFTSDAAHELRTPLAATRIQAQVAQLSTSDEQRTHALAQTMAGLDRATRLVEQMLRLARLDPLGRLADAQAVPLADLARRVVAGIRDTSPEATISLDLAAPDASVEGDAGLLEIALRNLIDNAVRYCPVDCRINVFLRTEGGAPLIGVSDNGPGVPIDELPRLIERFYRGNSVTAEGSGLGLTIVSRIAELHDAHLELANRTEGGQIVGFEARLRWEA